MSNKDEKERPCWSITEKYNAKRPERNADRMFVNGKFIPKSHPLWKRGRYKSFNDAAFSSLANYILSTEGEDVMSYRTRPGITGIK